MANASPCMPSGALAQVFFPPGGSSPPGSAVIQQGTPISMPSMPTGFPVMDLTPGQAPGGAVIPSLPPTPAGVSFIIQIGLTRESVLMPQSADLAYVKQIACSIVDTKVGNVCVCVCECKLGVYFLQVESCLCPKFLWHTFIYVFKLFVNHPASLSLFVFVSRCPTKLFVYTLLFS